MPLNLASPGILVREVDLTVGRVDPTSESMGALCAPFAQGPVEQPTLIENEQDLLNTFGRPYSQDKHYEHWLVASSFLAYGGAMRVIRSNDENLTNALVGVAASVKIKSVEHYEQLGYDENPITDVTIAARNPGSWANGIRVNILDGKADQILTLVDQSGISVGYGVTQPISSVLPGAGSTSVLDGYLKGIVTEVVGNDAYVKVLSHVNASGTEVEVDYQQSGVYAFSGSGSVAIHTTGISTAYISTSVTYQRDWFDDQLSTLSSFTSSKWNTLSDRPGTTAYAEARGSRFDEIHIIVVDAEGKITGNAGTILEKHLGLSKARDAEFSSGSPSYWRKYLALNSRYIFGGSSPVGVVTTGFREGGTGFDLEGDVGWDQDAEGITFDCIGNLNTKLGNGYNYDGGTNIEQAGALRSDLNNLVTGYGLLENTENYEVDFLLMGSASYPKSDAQALANKIIAVAELRKDAIAFISPYRGAAITDTSDDRATTINSDIDITDNVLSFFAPITSSSYGIFDSGYKYMYDRFANTFRYVPLNGDIAGTCARNDINQFPWFSPAGTTRGTILNAVKLAYNPSKIERDRLYSARVNPVIFSPGSGIILFGDKTGYAKASAFDRINVRRLFIYLEDAISAAAKDQLFEFNDEITRTNFVNIVDPFLRDVQAKRGLYDYVVICDETNNTPAVIDANEFIADIYVKPARSINFIGLTFIATRTGVAFEEVIGNF
jgi:phage tail sheath protein FI